MVILDGDIDLILQEVFHYVSVVISNSSTQSSCMSIDNSLKISIIRSAIFLPGRSATSLMGGNMLQNEF